MDKKGCGLLLMRNGAKSVFCGDEFWGKKRYCDKCAQNMSDDIRPTSSQKTPGCGLLIAKAYGRDIRCGGSLMRKVRYCVSCSLNYKEGETMKLEVTKDRIEINKIIENVLPLMKMNKNLTQECADCIIVYFIEKEEATQKTSKHNNYPTRQTVQTESGEELSKDETCSASSTEAKTGDLNSRVVNDS